jgi:FlaG/FlaF family flagellin (archaellin)
MVAITVILAALIASFVFPFGTPKMAPQANLKMTGGTQSDGRTYKIIKIDHMGGAAVPLDVDSVKITITVDDETEEIYKYSTGHLSVGERVYLYDVRGGTILGTDPDDANGNVGPADDETKMVTVTVIDRDSQQIISRTPVYW